MCRVGAHETGSNILDSLTGRDVYLALVADPVEDLSAFLIAGRVRSAPGSAAAGEAKQGA